MRTSKAAVRVETVVKRPTVHTKDVSLQVALLGGAVGAVTALERLPSWKRIHGNGVAVNVCNK